MPVTRSLVAEREEASRLRGAYEERQIAEVAERDRAEREKEAMKRRFDDLASDVEKVRGLLRGDRQRQAARINDLNAKIQELKQASSRNPDHTKAALERMLQQGQAQLSEFLRSLRTHGTPAPPPPGVAVSYLIARDRGFGLWLASALDDAIKNGAIGFDQRTAAEIAEERQRAEAQLAEAKEELARREDALSAAGRAMGAANRGDRKAVAQFLAAHGEGSK